MLSAIFPPEVRSQANLFHEMAVEFQRRGHEVAVITKVPTHYASNGAAGRIIPGWGEVQGIPTLRIRRFPLSGRGPFVRGIEHISLGFSFARASKQWPKADVVIVYSPPLPLGLSGLSYQKKFGAPVVLNVQDIYPQTAIDLGLLRNWIGIKLAERIEQRTYDGASSIVVHSPGNRQFLLNRKNVSNDKVRVIYNWVDTQAIRPGRRENPFRSEHGLGSRFVVSYAGLMGYAQDLSSIIECADHMRQEDDVYFLLVGEGVLEPRWREMAKERGLKNILFLPLQDKDQYGKLLAASNACLVPLSGNLRTPVVPGKLQSIMASGRPAIAIVDSGGDTPKLIDESGAGITVPPDQPVLLAEAIRRLKSNSPMAAEMGRRGRAFAESHFSLVRCADAYEQLFAEVVKN